METIKFKLNENSLIDEAKAIVYHGKLIKIVFLISVLPENYVSLFGKAMEIFESMYPQYL